MTDEDPRQRLAYDRTLLANERTFAAWIRTGLSVAAVGLALAHLAPEAGATARWVVAGLFLAVGVAIIVLGAWRFARVNRDLVQAGSQGTPTPLALVLALTLTIAALLVGVLFVL